MKQSKPSEIGLFMIAQIHYDRVKRWLRFAAQCGERAPLCGFEFRRSCLAILLFGIAATTAWSQGTAVTSQLFANGYIPGDGNNHAYLIASTVGDGGGDVDHLHLVATFNCDDYAGCNSTIDATFGNRGGFAAVYTAKGAYPTGMDVHIAAYRQSDNSTNIYLMLANYWDVATYSFLENIQDTVYSSPTDLGDSTPPGTLVFDTASPSNPPANYTDFAGDFFTVGNVGVGTTSPVTALQVNGSVYSTQMSNSFGFSTWPGNNATYNFMGASGMWGIRTDTSYGINFDVDHGGSPLTPLFIGQNGYVGIGTNAPSAALEVNGSIKLDGGGIIFPNGGGTQTAAYPGPPTLTAILGSSLIPDSNLPNDVVLTDSSSQQTINTPIAFTNSVGIGTTTPDTKLVVSDAAVASINIERTANSGQALMDFVPSGTPSNTNPAWGIGMLQNVSDFAIWRWNGSAISNSLTATTAGNIGIGTSTPGALLDVAGNLKISGSGASLTFPDNSVQSTAWNGTTYGDFAESVDVLGSRTAYEPGDVIVIDDAETGRFHKSGEAYSKLVSGVYSTKPGIVGRRIEAGTLNKDAEIPMAMVGIVPTKVSTENGPIERGDLLVSSSKPGYAMKGTDGSRMMGAVIGKALAPLRSGTGLIDVLISLQ